MSNWTPITEESVKATKASTILAKVRAMASAQGDADPLPEMIADVVATIRASISVGNTLDVDQAKIPTSLKGLALRMVVRRVKDFCQLSLTEDERKQADDDRSYLNRIADHKIRFEAPDTPAGSAEMQSAGGVDVITASRRFADRETMNGLL